MRRLLLAFTLAVLATAQLVAATVATSPGGWNHLGNGGSPTLPSLNGPVDSLNTDVPGFVYVGGGFTNAGGLASADRIARWNGTAWSAIGPAPLNNGQVNAIALHAGKVYIGGTFINAGGVGNADFLAEWTGTAWIQPCGGPAMSGTVTALQIIGNTLYVGGAFQNGSGTTAINYLFGCNLTSGAVTTVVAHPGDVNGGIYALAADSNGVLYAGGGFINMDAIPAADHVAAYDGTWHAMGAGVREIVRSLTAHGTDIYVGTDDTDIGGIAQADHVARWNGAWHALGSDTAGTGGWFNSFAFIYGMITSGPSLFVTGSFQNADGQATADDIAWFDGASWHPLGSNGAGNGPFTQNGLALAIFQHSVVVGGVFRAGSDLLAQDIASYAIQRPDARIGVKLAGPFIGNDIYNTTGAGQAKTITVARGNKGIFYVDTQNDGLAAEPFTIKGLGTARGYTITFFHGTTNVTAKVMNGTYQTAALAPGAHVTLKMVVKVALSSANAGTFKIRATTAGNAAQDLVTATVKAK